MANAVNSNISHYWRLDRAVGEKSITGETETSSKTDAYYGPAPRLQGVNNPGGAVGPMPSTHIDIRDDHQWTQSPRSSRGEVPVLLLKENRIMHNVALNQMANYGFAALGSGTETYDEIMRLKDAFMNMIDSDDKASFKFELPQNASSVAYTGTDLNSMAPYEDLYTVTPTKFVYSLPYMENNFIAHSNQFSESGDAGRIVDSLIKAAEIGKEVLQTINMNKSIQPGRMIEQPKAFTFTGREKSYTVSFPLFNTKSYADVVKNWEFLYLLSYQNTPNRINRDLIDPPCIYEASIPGVWYSKYAAITNMTVEFVGARREMEIPIKVADQTSHGAQLQGLGSGAQRNQDYLTLAVIPDAYQVTITISELFAETQNMKFQMLLESMNSRISTKTL